MMHTSWSKKEDKNIICGEGKRKRGYTVVAFSSIGTCVIINENDSNRTLFV